MEVILTGENSMDVQVGDSIITKKPHPCGNSTFAVLRVGMDFRIRCTKCGREVMVPPYKSSFETAIRGERFYYGYDYTAQGCAQPL